MGIRFLCPNGHKLHVKAFLAGRRGSCPQCGAKVLIPVPPEEPPPQLAPAAAEGVQVGPSLSKVPVAGTPTDFGSQSIVISVTESSLPHTPAGNAPPTPPASTRSTSPPAVSAGPVIEPIALEAATANPASRVAEAVEPTSPAVRYVVQRERNRRNQFTFAIVLLMAVIVLAVVLVYVLQRGAGSAPVQDTKQVGSRDLSATRHVALSSDRSFNAHGALAANW